MGAHHEETPESPNLSEHQRKIMFIGEEVNTPLNRRFFLVSHFLFLFVCFMIRNPDLIKEACSELIFFSKGFGL